MCNNLRLITGKKWLINLDSTGWMQSIAYLLSEVNMIVDSVRVILQSNSRQVKLC